MIATSGRLITGVLAMPPSAPRLVMVMVEPESSVRVAGAGARGLGQALHLRGALPQAARLAMADHRDHQAGRRLRRDADMDSTMPLERLHLVVVERVHLGKVGDRLDEGQHQEGHQGEARPILPALAIQGRAQFLERGDVDLLDVGEMGDPALRLGHLLGDAPPQPDDLDGLDGGLGDTLRRRRRPGPATQEASRSAWPIRPAGPLPGTWRRSTPASRARRRTAGEAIGFSPQAAAVRAAHGWPSLRELVAWRVQAPAREGRPDAASAWPPRGLARPLHAAPRPLLHCPRPRLRGGRAPRRPPTCRPPRRPARRRCGDGRRDLDGRLVGHDRGEELVLQHRLADLDMPFDQLGLGHALADIGKLDDADSHLRPPSRP
jgi:hypothetical protein